jgi:uncharacterized phage protein (TIGR01671 family)
MSRDIKFRGKRIDNGEWTYGYFFKIWERTYILWGTTNGVPNMIEVHPKTVGHPTGLKDHKGKDIYEGDIINTGKVIGVVDWRHAQYVLRVGDDAWTGVLGVNEVIGNIYENPDLLELA